MAVSFARLNNTRVELEVMNTELFKKLIEEDKVKYGSYAKLAKAVGLGNTTLYSWSKEIKIAPDIDNLMKYAKAIDCPAERKAKYFEACGYPVPEEFRIQGNAEFVRDVSPEDLVRVPIVGSVHAGEMAYAYEDIEGYMSIEKYLLRDAEEHFLLKIKGDCMDAAGLPEGSYALVAVGRLPENGQIAVIRDEDEAMIRRYTVQGEHVILEPVSNNPVHRPFVLTSDTEWHIVGTATMVINKL